MAKYKAYPEYKTTGLGWLTEIPDHWEVKKLKYLGQAIIGLTYSPDDVVDEGEGTLVLRSSNVQNGKLEFLDNVYVRKSIPLHLKVKEGDILICARNGSRALIGKNAKITKDAEGMTFGAFMSIFRSRYNNYLSHVFASALFEYQSGSFLTATINQLTTSNLNSFEIPLPPQTEQDRIVNFLDHETTKIENLIEKQQQLIELLKEKRQAVISHAVTKGLNPDVPMKDSGVEWLGDVPAHWDICLLKFKCSAITDGAHISPDTNEGEHYFVSIKDIKKGIIDFNNSLLTSSVSYKYLIKTGCKPFSGDILFSKDGTIGQTAIVPDDVDFVVASSLIIIRADKEKTLPAFMDLLLQSSLVKEQVESFVKGAALRRLSIQNLEKVFGIFPTLSEQQIISDYIYAQLNRLDVLESKAVVQIQLLEERRTALISAGVTGKIDVRDWVAPDTQGVEEPQEATA
ncbi:TPA: restriction endonuclease subunit S [Enterobacter cloacae]|nr:restriction endonuclease subunit S [Enterobacter cloacae]HBH7069312.1 restriction endonuclease subunit S [Enterobacter cloacae]